MPSKIKKNWQYTDGTVYTDGMAALEMRALRCVHIAKKIFKSQNHDETVDSSVELMHLSDYLIKEVLSPVPEKPVPLESKRDKKDHTKEHEDLDQLTEEEVESALLEELEETGY